MYKIFQAELFWSDYQESNSMTTTQPPQPTLSASPITPTQQPQSPRDYGLPHDEWRPQQERMIDWEFSIQPGQIGILEAPTGSGKTSGPAAMSTQKRVITLCRTKGLQSENYGGGYGFDVLYGRSNYDCVHPDNVDATTDECLFRDEGMHKCDHAAECHYLMQKARVKASRKASLNYPYWLVSHWPRESGAGALVLDEAHELSDIVLDFAGCQVLERDREKWDLPEFPEIAGSGGMLSQSRPTDKALAWLRAAYAIAARAAKRWEKSDMKLARQAERLENKLGATMAAIESCPDDWFIKSGERVGFDRGRNVPGIACKPLTARYHFNNYFPHASSAMILMSATIGDFDVFAKELGIKEFSRLALPSVWPPNVRPVQILPAPAMGAKSDERDYDEQARVIANAIKACPQEWSGVIHVTRKTEARLLTQRLAKRGLGARMWVPDERWGTEEQVAQWTAHKRQAGKNGSKGLGQIAVVWAWSSGVNLVDEKICITAKIPYPNIADGYECARMLYSGTYYLQRTAQRCEQQMGRTRRGNHGDYDVDGNKNQLVAIADANWVRIRKYLSQSFLESLVKE